MFMLCVWVCVCVSVCVCVWVCVCVCACLCVCLRMCLCMQAYICLLCEYVSYVWLLWMYVCVCVSVCAHVCTWNGLTWPLEANIRKKMVILGPTVLKIFTENCVCPTLLSGGPVQRGGYRSKRKMTVPCYPCGGTCPPSFVYPGLSVSRESLLVYVTKCTHKLFYCKAPHERKYTKLGMHSEGVIMILHF